MQTTGDQSSSSKQLSFVNPRRRESVALVVASGRVRHTAGGFDGRGHDEQTNGGIHATLRQAARGQHKLTQVTQCKTNDGTGEGNEQLRQQRQGEHERDMWE